MKTPLTGIRSPRPAGPASRRALLWLLFLLLGVGMGIFAKWLDTLVFDDSVPWQRFLGKIDPGGLFSGIAVWFLLALAIAVFSPAPLEAGIRVFLFYAGMCASYHLYSIFVVRFTPTAGYMLTWYGLTLVSPILAYFIWYARGEGVFPLVLNILILSNMVGACFYFGLWDFAWHGRFFDGIPNLILFLASVAVLYKSPKRTLVTVPAAFVTALFFSPLMPLLEELR